MFLSNLMLMNICHELGNLKYKSLLCTTKATRKSLVKHQWTPCYFTLFFIKIYLSRMTHQPEAGLHEGAAIYNNILHSHDNNKSKLNKFATTASSYKRIQAI